MLFASNVQLRCCEKACLWFYYGAPVECFSMRNTNTFLAESSKIVNIPVAISAMWLHMCNVASTPVIPRYHSPKICEQFESEALFVPAIFDVTFVFECVRACGMLYRLVCVDVCIGLEKLAIVLCRAMYRSCLTRWDRGCSVCNVLCSVLMLLIGFMHMKWRISRSFMFCFPN